MAFAALAIAAGVFLQALGRAFAGHTSTRSYGATLLGLVSVLILWQVASSLAPALCG